MFRRTKVSAGVLAALGGLVGLASQPTYAQQSLERVEITGSSIRRASTETALPVTVIKVDDLTKQGVTTTEQAMARIAANQSSFGASSSIGGTTGGKSEADLRGLSGPTNTNANKTLVLLNGRRLANHSFDAAAVDLNAIPLAAVDRIEVLRDGASAIYGSDAIGGVINFILKREYTGLEISAQTIQPRGKGGGDSNRVSLSGGYGSLAEQKFNIFGSLDLRKQSVLEAVDRNFAKTGIIRGAINAGTSGTSFPGDLNGVEPSLPNCNPPSSIPSASGTSCRYDFTRDIDILTDNEQITGLLRGTLALTPDHTVAVEYLHANNKSTAKVAPSPTSHVMLTSNPRWIPGAPFTQTPDPVNPGPEDINSDCGFTNCVDLDFDPNTPGVQTGGVVNWRTVPGGKRVSADDTTTTRAMVELSGIFSGWDYRTALGQTKNKSEASVKSGYLRNNLLQAGITSGVINPFGPQDAAGQAAIDAAQVNAPTQIGENKVNFVDLRVSKELMQMPAGMLAGAFGVEYRTEKSGFEALDITGELPSLGIDPDGDTSGKRKIAATYAELNIPVTKQLELTTAVRFDKYSGTGNTVNPKIGLRYQPTREVLIRGSANTGFRAPTLYELYQPQSLTFTSDNYDDPVLCPGGVKQPGTLESVVCGQQVLQRNVGPVSNGQNASSLDPEKAKNFSVGLVFDPASNVSFSVDYWQISIRNLITGLPEQEIFANSTKYSGRILRCSQLPTSGPGIIRSDIDSCLNYPGFDPIAYIDSPTENLGELKTRGLDLAAAWRSGATPMGSFGLSVDGTYVIGYKYQREKGGAFISATGRYSDNAPVFRWQHVATATWSMGDWSALLAQRFKTGYTDQDGVNDVASYALHDFAVTWTGVKNLTLTAGLNNVFDRAPPLSGQVTTFQRGYDPRFTDPLGRSIMLRASYKFF
ncbi:TonB-dependent receptor [Variovorax sp. YR752]|uniref:TonB-dependent receptor n=1 Tax=Variovorax sp. YR752 TaxID=1884383 RepID=UPI003137EE91